MEDDANPKTVTFDVGGRIFKVSRKTIDQHPDSMLACLVSDTWLMTPDKPVFIDRNGDIFAQVLDYLRYGSITLPKTVSKDMFLRDLEFYGITPAAESIKIDLMDNVMESFDHLVKYEELNDKRIALLVKQNEIKERETIKHFAYICFTRYCDWHMASPDEAAKRSKFHVSFEYIWHEGLGDIGKENHARFLAFIQRASSTSMHHCIHILQQPFAQYGLVLVGLNKQTTKYRFSLTRKSK